MPHRSFDFFFDVASGCSWLASIPAMRPLVCARGVFGAPAIFVGDELSCGNDRLDSVEEALRAAS